MAHGLIGIDHLVIGVDALEAARMAWTRLGFTLSPRGRHIGWGTANYAVMFQNSYLELLGIVDPVQPNNGLDRFLEGGEGAMSLAWASADVAASITALHTGGLACGPAQDLARQMELDADSVLLRFKLAHLPEVTSPGLGSFLCQHLTPDLLRQPAWLQHPNGAKGLHSLTIALDDPPAYEEAYASLFGPGNVNRTDDLVTIHVGPHRLILAGPADIEALYPELELDQSEGCDPSIVLVSLSVADIEATADYLTQWQIEYEPRGRNSLFVPGFLANGTALEFMVG